MGIGVIQTFMRVEGNTRQDIVRISAMGPMADDFYDAFQPKPFLSYFGIQKGK